MVIDTRGHDIPGGGDGWGYKQDMAAFSRSISSIQTAADLAEAGTLVDAMEIDAIPTNGTGWWIEAEDCLYVYRDATGFSKVLDEEKHTAGDIPWTPLPLHSNFAPYGDPNTVPMYKLTGDEVNIAGAMKVTSDAVGEEVNIGGSQATIAVLPSEITPGSDYGPFGIHQGSGDAVWLTQYDRGTNELRAARYRNTSETPPTTGSWFPFSIAYKI